MTRTDDTRTDRPFDDEIGDLLTLHEVAELLRVPQATLRYWRHCNTGPHSYKIGRHVRYRRQDVHDWLRGQRSAGSPDVA
jgi:excisionase family DNA binding protein